MKKRIIDKRIKEKFIIDDAYLNGMAKKCGWQSTIVYMCICRHADKEQECFPSIKLMQEKLGVGRNTIIKGVKNLEKYNIIKVEKERLKNGKWQNNVYILIDKSEWIGYQVPVGDTAPSPCGDTAKSLLEQNQVPVGDTKETHIKETHIKDIILHSNASVAGKKINDLIELFKSINPTYTTFYKNKTQRSCLERLLKLMGREKLERAINSLEETNQMDFAPKIHTPFELEKKLGALITFIKGKKNKNNILIV